MTFLILLTVLSVAAIAGTVRSVLHDASPARPGSHHVDPTFVAPGSRAAYERVA